MPNTTAPQTRVWKAQWPLATNIDEPYVLIYDEEHSEEYYILATPDVFERLFRNKWVRIYFRGRVIDGSVLVDEYVRYEDWL